MNCGIMSQNRVILICVCVLFLSLIPTVEDRRHSKRFTIESRGDFTDSLTQGLRKLNLSLLYQITPSVSIFEYHGNDGTSQTLKEVRSTFQNQIVAIEEARIYENTLKPVHTTSDGPGENMDTTNIVCSKYYGMGVTNVWKRNITGKGVTIAVNDIGINTDIVDLEQNVNKGLCKNFFTNTSDVAPERFSELVGTTPVFTDHGNKVASITAAVKNNNVSSSGIAYEATIVALKIYEVKLVNGDTFDLVPKHWTTSEVVSQALAYKLDEIDIFVNAWAPTSPFDQLDIATRNAIKYGATEGRHGLGAIYVVPAGPNGNELSNNIYTISVNSLGRNGSQPDDVVFDASVIISGLRDGNNLTASSMVTASYDNGCVTTFKGISAAVSQISGIIALGLQANPYLSLRDVQHLLVQASEHDRLVERKAFQSNGALKRFHNIFGFGLLNADAFVRRAETHEAVPSMLSWTLSHYKKRTPGYHTQIFEFCYTCDVYRDRHCLISLEHVTTTINFTTYARNLKTEIISPSKTHSVLMDLKIKKGRVPVTKAGHLVSAHFWDEIAFGKWHVKVQNKHSFVQTDIHNITVTLYGTRPGSKVDFVASHLTQCRSGDVTKGPNEENVLDLPVTTPRPTQSAWQLTFISVIVVVILVLLVFVCILLICYKVPRYILKALVQTYKSQ